MANVDLDAGMDFPIMLFFRHFDELFNISNFIFLSLVGRDDGLLDSVDFIVI